MISLWFLLFSLIISFFSKRDTLNCGLWAWSGSNVSLFNIDKFNILGFFNDDRGGDSSGRFMDRVVEKGIDKNADYKEWRNNVFERDNFTCQNCGMRGNVLHPHHIKSYTNFPSLRYDVNNGITLCVNCHHIVHWGH